MLREQRNHQAPTGCSKRPFGKAQVSRNRSILIIAYLVPVVWLAVKQTGVPVPQAIYGMQLQKVTERENQLRNDPKEKEVIAIFKERADAAAAKLKDVPAAMAADAAAAQM